MTKTQELKHTNILKCILKTSMESNSCENWVLWDIGDIEKTLQKTPISQILLFFLLFLSLFFFGGGGEEEWVWNLSKMEDVNDDLT